MGEPPTLEIDFLAKETPILNSSSLVESPLSHYELELGNTSVFQPTHFQKRHFHQPTNRRPGHVATCSHSLGHDGTNGTADLRSIHPFEGITISTQTHPPTVSPLKR